jgi:hypothetical protein
LPFTKRDLGQYVALYAYDTGDESDIRVTSGEVLTLLNSDDSEWLWVRRTGGGEGFVPKNALCRIPEDLRITGQ